MDDPTRTTHAAYASGDACPECGKTLDYDPGSRETRDEPADPPQVFCAGCGLDFKIDWLRQLAIAGVDCRA